VTYELYYWPTIQGRGEFVRLALEEAAQPYLDVAREKGDGKGVPALMALMKDAPRPSFAPPFLKDGEQIVGQVGAILAWIGERHGLAPKEDADRLWAQQIQLTLADLVAEAHDTHHPVGLSLYYKDQKPEAARRSQEFRDKRIPKFLGWCETILDRNPAGAGWLVGDRLTYADLSLFQVVEGLSYGFPKATERALKACPKVVALHEAVAARPRIAAYLASDRRIPFNEDGIFRHYPELDG
jgi:glutathione S-transferase